MMEIKLLDITENAEKLIEEAGRTAYLSFDNSFEGSEKKFIEHLIKRDHLSVLEHAKATFRIKGGSRAFTHQLVRHRIASFTQQSQRYVNESEFEFVTPPSIQMHPPALKLYQAIICRLRRDYADLQLMGVKREDARFVLPNATCSEIVITANLREWRHILKLRGSKHAQWEIRTMACCVYKILKLRVPTVVYDFIYCQANQTVTLEEM